VPVISPVVLFNATPAGKVPAVTEYVTGVFPPLVKICTDIVFPSTAGVLISIFEIESAAVIGPTAFDVLEVEPPALVAVTLAIK
jgi:hypothetical protein